MSFNLGACCQWQQFSDYLGYIAFGMYAITVITVILHVVSRNAAVHLFAVLYGLGMASIAIYAWDLRNKCPQSVKDLLCIGS
jgi:hypothetical protein